MKANVSRGRVALVAFALVVALAPAPTAQAHPGGHGEQALTPQPVVSAERDDGGGSSGILIAAVSVGLVGLGITLAALKRKQLQKERAVRLEPTSPSL